MSTENQNPTPPVHVRCLNSCSKLLAQIKGVILAELQATISLHEEVIRMAVNEAEALACKTEFPQLFFPTLAMEKVQAAAMKSPFAQSRQ
jgi:hypothetical protein